MTTRQPDRPLPDVAQHRPAQARELDWVGMDGIALPLLLDDGDGGQVRVAGTADVAVDLVDAQARGIHMSRLYLRLQQTLAGQAARPALLRGLLAELIASQNGAASRARLRLAYSQLLLRPALASAHAGWKAYPVVIRVEAGPSSSALWLQVAVDYSSTCPASTALSRQLNAERFAGEFAGNDSVPVEQVRAWLASERGLAATPHAQRSRATVEVQLADGVDVLDVRGLVDAIEDALGTPVQTAVKREDEQAFARRNAENLMFCEDAARRMAAVLAARPGIARFHVEAAHLESLHAHDAVARVAGDGPG